MALAIHFRWRGRCQKHPRYNPAAGEAAIKGGCALCQQLLELWRLVDQAVRLSRTMDGLPVVSEQSEPNPPEEEPLVVDDRQLPLFRGTPGSKIQ